MSFAMGLLIYVICAILLAEWISYMSLKFFDKPLPPMYKIICALMFPIMLIGIIKIILFEDLKRDITDEEIDEINDTLDEINNKD